MTFIDFKCTAEVKIRECVQIVFDRKVGRLNTEAKQNSYRSERDTHFLHAGDRCRLNN